MTDQVALWLHLLALGTYVGATVFVALVALVIARRVPDLAARQTFLAACCKVYAPLSIGALAAEVLTGALNVTRYKAVLMGEFYSHMGYLLAWKLALVFLLIMLTAYVAFAVGLRVIREEESDRQLGARELGRVLRPLTGGAWFGLLLAAAITWISLRMTQGWTTMPGTP